MTRYIIIVVAMLLLFSAAAFADGGFYGEVKYIDCDVTMGDKVAIRLNSGGPISYYYVDHLHPAHGYTTGVDTFSSGTYRLWVVIDESSDCDKSDIDIVIHGSSNQQVDLTVKGDAGTPD